MSELVYEGRPCKRCGCTTKYKSSSSCVKCCGTRSKAKYRVNKKDPAKKEAWAAGQRERRKDPKVRLREYKTNAAKRGFEWGLTDTEAVGLMQSPCHHCGIQTEHMGLDRSDNDKGYTETNSVPCCSPCNKLKHILTTRDFVTYCANVTSNYAKRAVA